MDYSVEILDEIALEGLDGITLDGLWLRLSERPNFLFSSTVLNDSDTKAYLFKTVKRLRDVTFYKLQEPRKQILSFMRYSVDPELGIITETVSPDEDIYPHKLICDVDKNIVGSCSSYNTRADVTAAVRKLEYSVVNSTYANSLVVVASQKVRKNALTGLHTNPNIELTPIQYCILERIGRARYHGEPTQGRLGLAAVGEDSKTIFYLRKYLLNRNLITKQGFRQKSTNNHSSGLLLHLPRFYKLIKPKFITLTENVINFLKEQPNNVVEFTTIQSNMPGVIKKLSKIPDFRKFVQTDLKVPYRELYPDASVKDWKHKSSDKEKKIRVVQLLDPNIDIREVQRCLLGNCEEEDEEEDKMVGILNTNQYIDIPLLTQCCMVLKDYGKDGLSQTEIAKKLGLSKVQARTISKNVVKLGAVDTYMVDIGRQRVAKFVLKDFSVLNENKFFIDYDVNEKFKHVPASQSENSNDSRIENGEALLDGSSCNEEMLLDDKSTVKMLEDCSFTLNKQSKRKNIFNDSVSDLLIGKKPKLILPEEKTNAVKRRNLSEGIQKFLYSKNGVKRKPPVPITINKSNLQITGINKMLNKSTPVINRIVLNGKFDSDLDNNSKNITSLANKGDNSLDKTGTDFEMASPETNDHSETVKDIDLDKTLIEVEISDDYNWLLPHTNKGDNSRLVDKTLKTSRLLKRSNIVIETVNELKVIPDMRKLAVMINESEYKEGVSTKMDKKSLLRILFKLALNNHIKVYRAALKSLNKVMYVNFICHPSVKPDHPIIKSSIEFNKLKFHTLQFNNLRSNVVPRRTVITYEKRTSFCHFPKFSRMKIVHKFLFYLVHEYKGSSTLDQDIAKSKISKDNQWIDDGMKNIPKLYLSKIDDKMFVQPLPKYTEQGENSGWFLLSDVLIRMPLSLFVQLVQVPYFIPDLDDYLKHPIKRHYLVSNLPLKIRNCLTATRKYIFAVFDVMLKLAYIGLLQLGVHQNKEKDQIFAFINRNALLLDTTLSKPGYVKVSPDIDYPVQRYRFDSMQDVEEYWHNCWKICMNTQLGSRSHVLGTEVVIEHIQDKQGMAEATKAREFLEAPNYDTGYLPGDRLGAAGIDSAMYAHMKRNWHKKGKQSTSSDSSKPIQVKKVQQLNMLQVKRPLKRNLSESSNKERNNLVIVPVNKCGRSRPRKANVRVRHINPVKKSLHRKPYYDQIDKEALKRMSKLRVAWSVEEDRVLLVCKIASAFICPHTRKQINANMFLAFREVLHKKLQTSSNKTSRACQRRVAYMLRSSSIRHNVNLCIEELKQNEYIVETYGNTLEFIKQEAQASGKKIVDLEYIWRERFKSLVDYLLSHYNSNNFSNFAISTTTDNKLSNSVLIPDTLQEFHNNCSLIRIEKKQHKPKGAFKPISVVNDIYAAVVNATIHSTLSCNTDKTSWSYHLFCIYQQYPEKVLRNALNKLRENQMVSYKKTYQIRNKSTNNYYLPLSASPYQLSISYVNLMQARHQTNTYFDCYKTFKALLAISNPNTKRKNIPVSNFDSKLYRLDSLTGGSTAAAVELLCCDLVNFSIDIPNQIVVLDPNIKDKDETYTRLVQRYKDILSNYKKELTSSILFQKHNYLSSIGEDALKKEADDVDFEAEDFEDMNDGSNVKTNVNDKDVKTDNVRAMQNVAKAASRIALYLMNEDAETTGMVPKEMDHVYDFFVVNSCDVFVKFPESHDMIVRDDQGIIKFANTVFLDDSIIRSTLQSVRDAAIFYDINSVKNELCSAELTSLGKNDEDGDEDKYKIKECDERTLKSILDDNFIDSDIHLVKTLLERIKDKKEIGLTNHELTNEFGNNLKIANIIGKLIDLSFIICAGVVSRHYVFYLFARPWLLHSYRNVRNEKDSRTPLSKYAYKCLKVHKNCGRNFENEHSEDDDLKEDDDKTLINRDECPGTSDIVNQSDDSYRDANDTEMDSGVEVLNEGEWKVMGQEDLKKLSEHNMSQPIRVLMRPWIRIDGTLNRKVLDMMLSSVLSHIMLNPGISLADIQYQFLPAYQPQHTHEVCEILCQLKCAFSYCVTTSRKPSLFSKSCNVLVNKSTGLEEPNIIRYESDKFAITNLGKFLDKRPYSRDFLQCLIGSK